MDNAFTVLPMSQAIKLLAGEVFEGEITVANPADAKEDFAYKVAVAPYSVVGEEYTADLGTRSDATQIVDWILIDEASGTLKPNESRKISFKITVPEDAPAGGQYAAIAVRSAEDATASSGTEVKNIFEIASILFAEVEGETIHEGEILANNVPGFSAENPAVVSAMFSNSGNVHEKAVTTITVKNALTGEQVFPKDTGDANQYVEYIMPGTTRYATREVSGLTDLGVFEISQTISYLGETSAVSARTVMCPIWFVVLIVLTVVAAILAIFWSARKRKTMRAEL